MPFDLAFWKPKAAPQPTTDVAALGEAVSKLVEDRVALYKAAIRSRASSLRAQAVACDSAALRAEITARADEDDYILEAVFSLGG